MGLILKNEIASEVVEHLPCSHKPQGGYFGGSTYCIGVPVRDVAEAFELGRAMGAEAGRVGDIGWDKVGNQLYVVFRSAEVCQGAKG